MHVDLSGLTVAVGRRALIASPLAPAVRVAGATVSAPLVANEALSAALARTGVHVAASRNAPAVYDDALRQAREAARRALADARDAHPAWLPGTRFVAASDGLRYAVEPPNPGFASRLVYSIDGGQTWTALDVGDAGDAADAADGQARRADLAGRTLQFGIFDGDGLPQAGDGAVDAAKVQVGQAILGADGGWSLAFEDPPDQVDRGDDDAVLNLFGVALAPTPTPALTPDR